MRRVLLLVAGCTSGGSADGPADTGDTHETADSRSDTAGPRPLPKGVTLTAFPPCTDPRTRDDRGPFTRATGGDAFAAQPVDAEDNSLFVAGGLAVADLDDDGRLDIVASRPGGTLQFWRQVDAGSDAPPVFEDARARLPSDLPARLGGVTAVDVDGDGDLDLSVTAYNGTDLLLRNDGGTFTDVAAELGLAVPDTRSLSTSWADVDGDGDLDGFTAVYGRLQGDEGGLPRGDASHLWVQGDDGTFTDLVVDLDDTHVLTKGHTFSGAFLDVDADRDPELLLVNDFGWRVPPRLVARGDDGWQAMPQTGVEVVAENMGLGVGDLNGDEVPDLLFAAWDGLGLVVSTPETGWVRQDQLRGLVPDPVQGQHVAWGTELADLDHDGDLDAVVVFGHLKVASQNTNPQEQRDAVFVQDADGRFVDRAKDWGLDDPGRQRGVVTADLDGDGWLDLVRADLRGPIRIDRARCGTAASLVVALRQAGPNTRAIGAHVRVVDGDDVWVRDVAAGGRSYASSGPPEVHVGVGDRDAVERVEITWPDGQVDVLEDVPTRHRVEVVR